MRIETADAFARLIAIYTQALTSVGERLPKTLESDVIISPFAVCEQLNARVVSLGALSDEQDAALAAIYEAMSARDARSEVEGDVAERLALAVGRIREEYGLPEPESAPEPEPEPEPQAAPVPAPEPEPAPAPEPEPQAASTPEPASTPEETLTVDQAAALLGVNRQEVYKLIKSQRLSARKQGRSWRISVGDVMALSAERSSRAQA